MDRVLILLAYAWLINWTLLIVLNQGAERTEIVAPSVSIPATVVGTPKSAIPQMPPPPFESTTAEVASRLEASAAPLKAQVTEAWAKAVLAPASTSMAQGAQSSTMSPPSDTYVPWNTYEIRINPSMEEMTSYVRRLVQSQSALHSEVKRLDTVCSSQ